MELVLRKIILTKYLECFFKGSNKNSSAGLGLYIVKEAVNKLNGIIKIESVVGMGTKLIMQIPE